jgi:hypothetical protein
MRLAFKARRLIDNAAVRADGLAVRPADFLEMGASGVFVREKRIG